MVRNRRNLNRAKAIEEPHDDDRRKFSLLRQVVWAATLATGFGTLWFAIVLWVGTSMQEEWRGGRRYWPPREALEVRSDGTLLISTTRWEDRPQTTYRDLSGRAQDVPDRSDLLAAVATAGEHRTPVFFSSQLGWEQRLKPFLNEREPTVNWFFVHDGKPEGAGYFVGYERVSNRCAGFIGLSGFRSQPVPAAEWIPVRGELVGDYSIWSSAALSIYSGRAWVARAQSWDVPPRLVYVPSGNVLRLVDLAARTVTTVFETAEPIEASAVPAISNWLSGRRRRSYPFWYGQGSRSMSWITGTTSSRCSPFQPKLTAKCAGMVRDWQRPGDCRLLPTIVTRRP